LEENTLKYLFSDFVRLLISSYNDVEGVAAIVVTYNSANKVGKRMKFGKNKL